MKERPEKINKEEEEQDENTQWDPELGNMEKEKSRALVILGQIVP